MTASQQFFTYGPINWPFDILTNDFPIKSKKNIIEYFEFVANYKL